MKRKGKDKKNSRKSLAVRLPKHVFKRIHQDIGQASMCWEHPEKAGVFDAKKAADIAFELCHFVADVIEEAKIKEPKDE